MRACRQDRRTRFSRGGRDLRNSDANAPDSSRSSRSTAEPPTGSKSTTYPPSGSASEPRAHRETSRLPAPDGSVALDALRDAALQRSRATFATWHERLDLDRTGTWRLRLASKGRLLVDAPFRVAATARNRPPNPVTLSLDPPAPTRDDVIQWVVHTSLVTEDLDYAIVRYRYRWHVAGKLVREVTSAGLSDVLRHRLARPGQRVSCSVTPSDGKLHGPTASVRFTVR